MSDKPKSLADYNEGDTYRGEQISKLYASHRDYLIYEANDSGEVTVATDSQKLRNRIAAISPRISLITEYLVSKKEKSKFVDHIGLAYAEAIEGNIEHAQSICDKLIGRIELYKCNIGRFYYLLSCFALVVIVLLVSFYLKRCKLLPEIFPYFQAMTFASIGGFLSVTRTLKSIQIDSSDFGWFQFFYGAIRIVISMLSGLVLYVLIRSELVLPQLNYQENIFIVYILSIIAGFSESCFYNNVWEGVKL